MTEPAKLLLTAMALTAGLARRGKGSARTGVGLLEGALGFAGIATLLLGLSFVKGALEENEPRAARMGLRAFGGAGLGLLLLAGLAALARRR